MKKNVDYLKISELSPIVIDLINSSHIIFQSKSVHLPTLFYALLIANHPKITYEIEKIRSYIPKNDNSLEIRIAEKNQRLHKAIDDFFIKFTNIYKEEWYFSIFKYITLGELLVLDEPYTGIEIISALDSRDNTYYSSHNHLVNTPIEYKNNYPVIVLMRKITKKEQLIDFIDKHFNSIKEYTENLTKPPITRKDADIVKLCIGLWIVNNSSKGNKWIDKQFETSEKLDKKYFGQYRNLEKTEFATFKSDALFYLNRLYPI